jgi:hypothetical protein
VRSDAEHPLKCLCLVPHVKTLLISGALREKDRGALARWLKTQTCITRLQFADDPRSSKEAVKKARKHRFPPISFPPAPAAVGVAAGEADRRVAAPIRIPAAVGKRTRAVRRPAAATSGRDQRRHPGALSPPTAAAGRQDARVHGRRSD